MSTAEMEIPRQLRKAAKIIEKRGHKKHSFGSPKGPVCLASALAEANGTPYGVNGYGGYPIQKVTEAGRALINELLMMPTGLPSDCPVRCVPVYPLCGFNNRSTQEQITNKLRGTADKFEKLGIGRRPITVKARGGDAVG